MIRAMQALVCLALVLVGGVTATNPTRAFSDPNFIRAERISPQQTIDVIFALKHANLDKLDSLFWEVSDPKQANYGQHADLDQLTEILHPGQDLVEQLTQWIGPEVQVHPAGDFAEVKGMTVAKAEQLLGTELHRFTHSQDSSVTGVRASSPLSAVPQDIVAKLDFVSVNAPIVSWRHHSVRHTQDTHQAQTTFSDVSDEDTYQWRVGALPLNEAAQFILDVPCVGSDGTTVESSSVSAKDAQAGTNPCPDRNVVKLDVNWPEISANFSMGFVDFSDLTWVSRLNRTGAGFVHQYAFASTQVEAFRWHRFRNFAQVKVAFNGITYALGASEFVFPSKPIDVFFYAQPPMTPQLLKQVYGVPTSQHPQHGASQGVAEFLGQQYGPADLRLFLDKFGYTAASGFDRVVSPNGAKNNGSECEPPKDGISDGAWVGTCGEADLDVQVMRGMTRGQPQTTYYTTSGENKDSTVHGNEPFMVWLSFMAKQENSAIPDVISFSYGDTESTIFDSFKTRVNQEFQKLGARGVSIVFSSGDDGAPSNGARSSNATIHAKACATANPAFPASSPFVTTVGATQILAASSEFCASFKPYMSRGVEVTGGCSVDVEVMCNSATQGVVTSGGGFSDFFKRPMYQEAAVQKYLTSKSLLDQKLPAKWWNPAGRGYPDVAVYGNNFPVYEGGQLNFWSGTSAAAPLFASMVTLWNDIRLGLDQPKLGFLNPWLYDMADSSPQLWTDIVSGVNNCGAAGKCCTYGYSAAPGWDAVTGLGSPRFEAIAQHIRTQAQIAQTKAQIKAVAAHQSDQLSGKTEVALFIVLFIALAGLIAGLVFARYKNRQSNGDYLLNNN